MEAVGQLEAPEKVSAEDLMVPLASLLLDQFPRLQSALVECSELAGVVVV